MSTSQKINSINKSYLQTLGPNQAGRDFVVGDIHGFDEKLCELLEKARFSWGTDRIVFASDLVDRGPNSPAVLLMLRKPGVHAVRGNHDQWCIEAGLVGEPEGHKKHGGDWFYTLTASEKRYIAELLNRLPVAISFIGPDGKKYGVVHAECTTHEWSWFEEVLTGQWGESSQEQHVIEAMWRRSRYAKKATYSVCGIERVFVGHTVVDEVTELGNTVYLDTGACFEGGYLSMAELLPQGGYHVHQI